MRSRHFLFVVVSVLTLLLSSCYEHSTGQHPMYKKAISERTIDSLSFFQKHHYTNNYNFVVRADSLTLLRQLPEEEVAGMETDSFSVRKGDHLAVADIKKGLKQTPLTPFGCNWPTTLLPSDGHAKRKCCLG